MQIIPCCLTPQNLQQVIEILYPLVDLGEIVVGVDVDNDGAVHLTGSFGLELAQIFQWYYSH